MKNPFVTKGYAGPDYFCDRTEETKNIVQLLTNENNIALISPRRLGKTDLIRHVFNQAEIRKNYYTFLIDIYATSSLNDFVSVFSKAILEELKPNANPTTTLEEIFSYLNSANKPCIVAIDEFQRITDYPNGENVEAALRTHIQRCPNATFLFSGSKRHLMSEIFTSASRPFFQSVITMGLSPIPLDKYEEFAMRQFANSHKALDKDVVANVYSRFDGITLCLQRVMNVLFMLTEKNEVCKIEMVDDAITYLLNLFSDNFETQLSQMPEKQRTVFRAIAQEGKARNVMSGDFVKRHRLSSPSSVSSAIKALLDKDLITQDKDAYMVYDQFFALWLMRN